MNAITISKIVNKRNIILLALFIVLLVVFNWVASHSYIDIQISGHQENQETELSIDGETLHTKESSIKKLIKKGNHVISVKQSETSYFTSVKTDGFLGTKHINAGLVGESLRSFGGNNIKPCGAYGVNGMYSWQCGGFIKSASLHAPATQTTPSLPVEVTSVNAPYYIEAFVSLGGVDYFVVRAGDIEASFHAAFPVGSDGKIQFDKSVALKDLNANKVYGATPYKNGTLFFSTSDKEFVYYENISGGGDAINTGSDVDTGQLAIQSVDTNGDSILVSYTNTNSPEYRGMLSGKSGGGY